MKVTIPEVKKCCCCFPLRPGIILFGYVNFISSLLTISCLVVKTELKRHTETHDVAFEVMTSTVLFSILGMGLILNILLLVAGYQKDESMLRLYSYYSLATIMAALVPTFTLLSRLLYLEVSAALVTILVQCYLFLLVRSEVVKLETERINANQREEEPEEGTSVLDTVTLL